MQVDHRRHCPCICVASTCNAGAAKVLRDTALRVNSPYAIVQPLVPSRYDEIVKLGNLCILLREFGGKERVNRLGIDGEHQRENAALAIALATTFLLRTGRSPKLSLETPPTPTSTSSVAAGLSDVAQFVWRIDNTHTTPTTTTTPLLGVRLASHGALPAAFVTALARCAWPGRAHVVRDAAVPNLRFVCSFVFACRCCRFVCFGLVVVARAMPPCRLFVGLLAWLSVCLLCKRNVVAQRRAYLLCSFLLDGAHTVESMLVATKWFLASRLSRTNKTQYCYVYLQHRNQSPNVLILLSPLLPVSVATTMSRCPTPSAANHCCCCCCCCSCCRRRRRRVASRPDAERVLLFACGTARAPLPLLRQLAALVPPVCADRRC
jgi:hypothetical protein